MAVSHVQLHQYPQQCTTQTQRAGPVRLQLHSGVGEGQSRGQDRTGQHAKGMLSLLQRAMLCNNSVSYTNTTLPTNSTVYISVVAV